MKNSVVILLAFIAFQPFVINASNRAGDVKTEFTAKVNGKEWKGAVIGCNAEISSMEFFGYGEDKNSLKITINAAPGEGTFEIGKRSGHKISYGSNDAIYTIGQDDKGTVVITKYDAVEKLFSGTFEFTLTNAKTGKTIKITNGVFNNMQFYDNPKNDFELKAKLDGVEWKWSASTWNVSQDTAHFSAVTDSEKFLHVKFPQNTGPGEYNITADGAYYAEYKSLKNNNTGLKAKSGRLIILTNDAEKRIITGQFEVELIDAKGDTKAVFTDGSFTLLYNK